jgi:hypothetical protein
VKRACGGCEILPEAAAAAVITSNCGNLANPPAFPAPSKSFSDGTETVNEARRGGRGGMGGNVIRVAVGDVGEDRLMMGDFCHAL